ncbi:Hypothetical predicted protein [Paramuricea clavata]|uniref:Uncharacterized protein n=1 Tax=Paramuricea clavata TaxID=317549 RepID=A0A6S7IV74_PARCT|nr:Hypothetical predicted protein [Paramuricea clavata]
MAPKNCKRIIPETKSIPWVVYIRPLIDISGLIYTVLVTTCLIIIVIGSCFRGELRETIVVPTNDVEPPQSVKPAVATRRVENSAFKDEAKVVTKSDDISAFMTEYFSNSASLSDQHKITKHNVETRRVENNVFNDEVKVVTESDDIYSALMTEYSLNSASLSDQPKITKHNVETRRVENNVFNDEVKVVTESGYKPDILNYQRRKIPHFFRKRGSQTKTRPGENSASKYVAKAVRESHLKVTEPDPKQDIISDLKLGVEIFGPVMNSSGEAVSEPIFGTKFDMEHFAHDTERKTELKV